MRFFVGKFRRKKLKIARSLTLALNFKKFRGSDLFWLSKSSLIKKSNRVLNLLPVKKHHCFQLQKISLLKLISIQIFQTLPFHLMSRQTKLALLGEIAFE